VRVVSIGQFFGGCGRSSVDHVSTPVPTTWGSADARELCPPGAAR